MTIKGSGAVKPGETWIDAPSAHVRLEHISSGLADAAR